jgi:hypothetical protein
MPDITTSILVGVIIILLVNRYLVGLKHNSLNWSVVAANQWEQDIKILSELIAVQMTMVIQPRIAALTYGIDTRDMTQDDINRVVSDEQIQRMTRESTVSIYESMTPEFRLKFEAYLTEAGFIQYLTNVMFEEINNRAAKANIMKYRQDTMEATKAFNTVQQGNSKITIKDLREPTPS